MERDYDAFEQTTDARNISMAGLAFERLEKSIARLAEITEGFDDRLTPVLGPSMLADPHATEAESAVENRSPLVRQIDALQERLERYVRMLDSMLNRVQV